MRTIRILVVAALAASAAAVAPLSASAAPPSSPYTAFTMEGTPIGDGYDVDEAFDASTLTVTPGDSGSTIQFVGSRPSTSPYSGFADATITENSGAPLTPGSYPLGGVADEVSFYVIRGQLCVAESGLLTIDELTDDADTGEIASFAGHYTVTCAPGQTITGVLRWNSTLDFAAALASPQNWDFGSQLVKANGWAKTFTFANRGTTPITYAGASIYPAANAKNFAISGNGCSGHTVPSGASCSLTITPRPQTVNDYGVQSTLQLATTGTGAPRTRVVQLQLRGSRTPGIYAVPGPSRIQLFWGQPTRPIGAGVKAWDVQRGTSPSHLTHLRFATQPNMTDSTVVAGRTYYYAILPHYDNSVGGDRSPVVAAMAWPKYSAGMYHRLSSASRVVNGHKVVAGHPYTFKIDGGHGIPASHVAAAAVTVIAKNPSRAASVTLYPTGSRKPAQPDLTVARGGIRSNFAVVKVGTGGRITISTSHGTTPVYVDVSGYYSAAGLSTKYGTGAAAHTYVRPGTILDTKAEHIGALKHNYYVEAPVNFDQADTPHVTSLAVEITAYDSTGSGTVAAYPTNGRLPGTSVAAYSARTTSSTYAIVRVGRYYASNGNQYPSISLLNRGTRSVQLIVTVVGFYDDDTFLYGERYTPTTPIHLSVKNPLHSGSLRTLKAGYTHANVWTTALNVHVSASTPSKTTMVQLWPRISGVKAPAHGQLRAPAHQSTLISTVAALGGGNEFYLRNTAGTTSTSVWSFGRFDAYPVPSARDYASVGLSATPAAAPERVTVDRPAPTRFSR